MRATHEDNRNRLPCHLLQHSPPKTDPVGRARYWGSSKEREKLACPGGIGATRRDGFIQIDIAVANLDIEPASWVDADPGLVMDRSPLTAVVRERDETPNITTQAFGHRRFFHGLLLPTRNGPSIPPAFVRELQYLRRCLLKKTSPGNISMGFVIMSPGRIPIPDYYDYSRKSLSFLDRVGWRNFRNAFASI